MWTIGIEQFTPTSKDQERYALIGVRSTAHVGDNSQNDHRDSLRANFVCCIAIFAPAAHYAALG